MTISQQIEEHLHAQPEPKRSDMQTLHSLISGILPEGKLWFEDGKNQEGKIVSNPSVGYGSQTLKYANGTTKEYFQIGISGNKSGISIYILGIADNTYLPRTYEHKIGKASVTGYCIRFKQLKDIDFVLLEEAIRYGIEVTSKN
ncbi:DUF1801 domain-containing protein [Pedobacter petrophilus]|uniref:DUF1801 domain-containing protein n=1 Tax=Pedobacter petrophilus TaxID=1908241 RepID=A0A7K0G2C7_9SPHI|nr:DUF1801 domain-containing protein [Pedobacter petrophilus]MRX77801.1 DUF1801 domain-containing protein [Pedobacter petrophilus]